MVDACSKNVGNSGDIVIKSNQTDSLFDDPGTVTHADTANARDSRGKGTPVL